MRDNTLQAVVTELEARGIGFSVNGLMALSGIDGRITLSSSDVHEFLADPEHFIASAYGVSKADYIAFKNEDPLRCAATTRKGRQCKHLVNGGGGQIDIKTYAKLRGGYCAIHGG